MVIGDTNVVQRVTWTRNLTFILMIIVIHTLHIVVRIVCRFFTSYSIIVILVGYFIHAVMVLSEVRLHSDS